MRLFVDQLTNLDFSYLDAKRGLVGETWLASIELDGALDEQGMVCDFGTVKKTIREWLDTHLDHKLVIPSQSHCANIQSRDGTDSIEWLCDKGLIRTQAPSQAHCLMAVDTLSPETAAQWCVEQLETLFPDSISTITLRFTAENIDGPFYHYSHGLQQHAGNCQRIAHGHRSRIDIWQNDSLSLAHREAISQRWADIYIGTEAHCAEDDLHPENYLFEYQAQQGKFMLSLPKAHCYLMNTETTVELIAEHLVTHLKDAEPESRFRVKAFEGIAKGAIAERE